MPSICTFPKKAGPGWGAQPAQVWHPPSNLRGNHCAGSYGFMRKAGKAKLTEEEKIWVYCWGGAASQAAVPPPGELHCAVTLMTSAVIWASGCLWSRLGLLPPEWSAGKAQHKLWAEMKVLTNVNHLKFLDIAIQR